MRAYPIGRRAIPTVMMIRYVVACTWQVLSERENQLAERENQLLSLSHRLGGGEAASRAAHGGTPTPCTSHAVHC